MRRARAILLVRLLTTIRLAMVGPENDVEVVKIIAADADVHHFDSATCEAEGHGPDGAATSPVHQIVNLKHHEFFCL